MQKMRQLYNMKYISLLASFTVPYLYLILQVREPYSVVMYLAERLDVPHLLDLHLPEGQFYSTALRIRIRCDPDPGSAYLVFRILDPHNRKKIDLKKCENKAYMENIRLTVCLK